MKLFGLQITRARPDFKLAQKPSNVELTPPLALPGGQMLPEYMKATRVWGEVMLQLLDQQRDHNGKMGRAYDAGKLTNLNLDLKGTYNSANTEMFPDLYRVRANARTIDKDTGFGRAAVRTLADNVVGDDPFELEMDDDKIGEAAVEAIQNGWKQYCRKKNFTKSRDMGAMEAYRVIEMSRGRDGNIIMKIHDDYKWNEFGFTIELNEQDRLFETYSGFSGNDSKYGPGNPIIASIEFHKDGGFPVAYWISSRHPGEAYAQLAEGKMYRVQWPAEKIILWSNLKTRAEQILGMTEMDAALQPLWRIYQYSKSLTVAAIASCIKPFVLEKKLPTGMQIPNDMDQAGFMAWFGGNTSGGIPGQGFGSTGDAAKQEGAARPVQQLSPGMERELPFGVEAKILDPKFPVEAAENFIKSCLREIAVAFGVSYQDISGDFQNLGFIAGLMCQQPKQRYMRIRQNSFIENLMELFEKWLRASIMHGYFDKKAPEANIQMSKLDDYVDAAKFKGQQWEFVNPLVQAQALILLHEAGHISRQQIQDLLPHGMRFKKLVQVLRQEYDELKKADLTYDMVDVTRPTISKGEPGQTVPEPGGAASAQPPPKSKLANPVRAVTRMKAVGDLLEMCGIDAEGEMIGERINGLNGDHHV